LASVRSQYLEGRPEPCSLLHKAKPSCSGEKFFGTISPPVRWSICPTSTERRARKDPKPSRLGGGTLQNWRPKPRHSWAACIRFLVIQVFGDI
jgi:hypothetical protein